jgi:hypothetical protein
MMHKIGKRANSRKEFIIMIFWIMVTYNVGIGWQYLG